MESPSNMKIIVNRFPLSLSPDVDYISNIEEYLDNKFLHHHHPTETKDQLIPPKPSQAYLSR